MLDLVCAEFAARKALSMTALSAGVTDRSPKGSVDAPIEPLIQDINAHPDYYTTSSCSGRVALFRHTNIVANVKEGRWLVCEHRPLSEASFRSLLADNVNDNDSGSDTQSLSVLKFEPFILSVACRSLSAAHSLLALAQTSGCRESGITAVHHTDVTRPIMVSIRCSIRLETPLLRGDTMLVSDSYLAYLIATIRDKFAVNEQRLNHFHHRFKQWHADRIHIDTSDSADEGKQSRSLLTVGDSAADALRARQERVLAEATALNERIQHLTQSLLSSPSLLPPSPLPLSLLADLDDFAGYWSLVVPRQHVALVRNACKSLDYNNTQRKVAPLPSSLTGTATTADTDSGCMALPINDTARKTIGKMVVGKSLDDMQAAILSALNLPLTSLPAHTLHLRYIPVASTTDTDTNTSSGRLTPQQTLANNVRHFCHQHSLPYTDALASMMPHRWEQFGDLIVLANDSLAAPPWQQLLSLASDRGLLLSLYQCVCLTLKCQRLALQSPIEPGLYRRSQVKLLYGDSGLVHHRENSVNFVFNVTETMFSSGNGSEKQRLIQLIKREHRIETIVDLYCGIGFWVAPVLTHCPTVIHVVGVEHNPLTFQSLLKTLRANNIPSERYTVVNDDNRSEAVRTLVANRADRVLLGLLPSSEDTWLLSLLALKPTGGTIHLHANVPHRQHAEYANTVLSKFRAMIANELGDSGKGAEWTCRVRHVEVVKSFAPHVDHVVIDLVVQCGSALPMSPSPALPLPVGGRYQYRCDAVACYDNPTYDQFWREIVPLQQPVVLRGLSLGDRSKFSLQSLAAVGDAPDVSVHVCPDLSGQMNFIDRNYVHRVMSFTELIDRILTRRDDYFISPNERLYLRSLGRDPKREIANFYQTFPTLAQHTQMPAILAQQLSAKPKELQIFSSVFRVSSAGLSLWTHYDVAENVLCHLTGTKRVVLFPPTQSGNLYLPLAPHSSSSPVMDVNGSHGDSESGNQWLRFGEAQRQGVEVELQAGECLYIPALWFHHVTSLTDTVSINYFWRELPAHYYTANDLYGNKDLIVGVKAMELGSEIAKKLSALPTNYRDFYAVRAAECVMGGAATIEHSG